MKTPFISGLGMIALLVAAPAVAQPRHDQHPQARQDGMRTRGTIARPRMSSPVDARRNAPHQTYWQNSRTGREEHHAIVYEHRAPQVIAHDRYARRWARAYRPHHEWGYFHPSGGWIGLWGIEDFSAVSGVTCEAANEETGELYPVTANTAPEWSNAMVDSVLDQALDECAAAAGENVCVPAQPACTVH